MRLRTKLLSLTIVPLVLLLGLILLISQMTQRISAMEKAVAQAEVILMREAVPFFNLLNRNYSIAVQLAETISILKNHGRTERGPLISLVRAVQKDNPELFGSWLMFDPDALDDDADFMPEKLEGASVETVRARMRELYGPDADFSPNDVATLEGSFCTYWITDEQKRIVPVTAGENDGFDEPYYALAKESGKVSFPPIYMDADTKALVTTISAPVLDQGKVIGVAGVDMSLASMQEEMGGIRIMGDGFVTVVSEDGMILATHDPSMVGKDISLLFPDKVKAAIKSREGYSHVDRLQNHGRRFLHQIRSLSYGDGSTSWGFIVSLPLDEIMAESLKDGMIELFISVVGIILVLVMIIWLIGRMTRDIAAGVNYAEAIASGRLDAEFSLRRGDEIGLLADSLRKMTAWMKSSLDESSRLAEENARSREKTEEALAAIKTKVNKEQERQAKMRELAERIDMIAGDLRSEINILVERIQKAEDDAGFTMAQAQKNKEAVHILEEITAQVLRQVEIAVSSTEGAKEQAVQGDEVMKAVSGSVERIARSSENLKLILSSLAGRAQGVGDILTVISDIADQTNLLALNAAIEAARAGEAGRGFAVVADEVRKLAEKTMQSTKQVGDVTGSIKEETLKSVGAMEESLQEVQASSEHSASSSAALKDIVALVEKSAAEVSLISSISAKQAEANESIVHASDQVEEIAQNTVQTMRAASEGVGHMADLAHKLAETTSALRALE